MIYEILDDKGTVVNRIIADLNFVEKHYKGLHRDVTPEPIIEEEKAPVETLEEKVDKLIIAVAALTAASAKP
jgi:hypothetical protein